MIDYSTMTIADFEELADRLGKASATIKEALAMMHPQAPSPTVIQQPKGLYAQPLPLTNVHVVAPEAPVAPVSTMQPNPDGTYGPRRSRTPPPPNPPELQLTAAEQAEKNLVLAKMKAKETA